MRDLTSEEIAHVYGARSKGKSPSGPKHRPCRPKKRRNPCRGGGSGSGSSGHGRCGKGGSS